MGVLKAGGGDGFERWPVNEGEVVDNETKWM
jgi:hypothetical protein